MLETRSILFCSVALLSLSACGGGGAGNEGASGVLTISNATPSMLNGTCKATGHTVSTTTNSAATTDNHTITLDCGVGSKVVFNVDAASKQLIAGEAGGITLDNGGTPVAAYCEDFGTCAQVSLDAGVHTLSFTGQVYQTASTEQFTVTGTLRF